LHYSYTGSRRKTYIPLRIHKKKVLLLHREWTKNILVRLYQNKCSKYVWSLSQKFCSEKRHEAIIKKSDERKRETWKKRKGIKDSSCSHKKVSLKSIKREKCFKEHNRIRIASLYPHTRTSWFYCMIFFSMDPLFDLAKYAIQVCFQSFPTWAPQKLFRSRKKRKGKTQNALVRKQTLEWFESTIWGVHVNYALFQKKTPSH